MSKTVMKKARDETLAEKLKHLPGTSRLEWLIAGACAMVLGMVIVYLAFVALSSGNGPAQIEITVLGVIERQNAHVVEFVAVNRAGRSAAGVEVQGQLRDGSEVVEEASVTLDYVPRQSERRGGLIFRNSPEGYDLDVFATGYFEP